MLNDDESNASIGEDARHFADFGPIRKEFTEALERFANRSSENRSTRRSSAKACSTQPSDLRRRNIVVGSLLTRRVRPHNDLLVQTGDSQKTAHALLKHADVGRRLDPPPPDKVLTGASVYGRPAGRWRCPE